MGVARASRAYQIIPRCCSTNADLRLALRRQTGKVWRVAVIESIWSYEQLRAFIIRFRSLPCRARCSRVKFSSTWVMFSYADITIFSAQSASANSSLMIISQVSRLLIMSQWSLSRGRAFRRFASSLLKDCSEESLSFPIRLSRCRRLQLILATSSCVFWLAWLDISPSPLLDMLRNKIIDYWIRVEQLNNKMYGKTDRKPDTDPLATSLGVSSAGKPGTLIEPPTTLPKPSIRRALLPEFLDPPSQSPSIPQSYLLAMRALQSQLDRTTSELSSSVSSVKALTDQNASLKEQLLQSEREKLQTETKINAVLKDYNTLCEVLEQTRFEGMLLKKEIEQLKREKQNVLEKVTEKVCKERAIDKLIERDSTSKSGRKDKHNSSLATVKENIDTNSNFRTPYLKEAVSTEIPRVSELPLVTLNPNIDSPIRAALEPSPLQTPSISLLSNRYQPLGRSSSSSNRSYVQLVKSIMKKEKLLVEMTHQLECYQKQLLERKFENGKQKELVLTKIDILRGDINRVRLDIVEGRRKQSLL